MTRACYPQATHRRRFSAPVAVVFVSAVAASAQPSVAVANPKTFRQATAKDFDEGEVTGASILATGDVVPGLIATRVALDAAFVWCSVASRDGATAYFGSGEEGKIFGVPARGDAKIAQRVATLDAPWVTALATRADGKLLAATTPGGRVFVVDPGTGGARVLANVGTGHVWALARDDRASLTYVGTGAPGKILAVDDSGKSSQVWDSHDKHVVSLMRDTDGTLLAGTSEAAILYRVHVDGRVEAIEDFDAEEVRAVVRAPSGLFVAVNDFEKAAVSIAAAGTIAPAKGTKIVAPAGPPASAGSLPRPGTRKAKAAVYRIENDGRIEQVFSLADGYLTALAVADDGSVYAAAGTQGHVFRVATDRTSSLVIDLPERQVLTLLRMGGTVLAGTGDVGGVYRATPPAGNVEGRYLSKVLDAEFPAHWGAMRWMGSQVTLETRSGNTAKPDEAWTPWQALERSPAGKVSTNSGEIEGHVASPSARYLQYRASLRGQASHLRGVTTSYLPQNQRAHVTEVTLADGAGTAPAALGASTAGVSPRSGHSAILKLRWKTDNPDGDDVIYRLAFRQVGESVWRPLISASVDSLTKPEYDWNTEGIPDGLYVVRVTVSDEKSQPRDRALASAFESSPLLVDNGRPQVEDLTARYPVVTGRAKDDASAITQIEFAVDGAEFQLVSPADGIADDLIEPFTIRLPPLTRGPHAVAVRITDSADNIGSARITLKAP